MAKGHCPICFEANRKSEWEITPTGEAIAASSSRYWRLVLHPDGAGRICPGSGRKI